MSTITSAATAGASAVLPQTQAVSGTPAVSTTGNSTPSVASTAGNGQQTTPSNPPLIN
ncbi:MAG: hypothetical protein JO253_09375, partial [Alphaproteobacteria bacterium]|nr:hypothetical protein [Alphaproteobacteria bacterium]